MKCKHGQVNIKGGGETQLSLQRLDEIGFWLNSVGKGNLVFMQISLRRNLYAPGRRSNST